MRTVTVYVNDQLYKQVTVEDYPEGSGYYNPAYILTVLDKEKQQGLLDRYLTPDGKFVIKMLMIYH